MAHPDLPASGAKANRVSCLSSKGQGVLVQIQPSGTNFVAVAVISCRGKVDTGKHGPDRGRNELFLNGRGEGWSKWE